MAFVWEQRKLGDITESYSGGTPTAGKKEYYDGNIPFIRSGEISSDKTELFISEEGLNRSSAKMVKIGDILYALYGATSGEVSISKLKGAINQAILAIQPHQNYDSQFLMQWLRKSKENIIGTYLQGGQGNLSGNIVKELIIDIPTYEEQKEIGAYLKKLDHLITLHQRKRMLRKCFFSIDWEQRKLGEVADIVGGGTPSTNVSNYWDGNIDWYAPAEISDQIFLSSSQRKITEKGYNNSSAKMLPIGTVLFTSRAGIGKTAILSKKGCTNQGFQSIVPHKDELDSYFIFSRTDELKRYGEIVGAGSTFVEVSGKQMANIEMMMPKTISEQKVIGAYFAKLDHLITLHQCKSNFCKKNEVNAWEQRKLGKIVEVHNGKDYKHLEKGNIPVYGTGGYMLSVSESLSDTQDAIGIGRKGTIDKPYILRAPFWTVDTLFYCIPREENDLNFIFDIFQNINWRLMDESTGVPSLSKKSINNVKILVPNKKEQKQIGLYFNQLDHLITLHQWECNINENTEGNDEKQRKPIKKLIISEGNLSLVDDMFLLHRMTFLVCNKYILLRLNVVKYKITIIIISNILYSIVSLLIIACYLIVINKQLIILIYVEISVVIIKGDDDYARIRS